MTQCVFWVVVVWSASMGFWVCLWSVPVPSHCGLWPAISTPGRLEPWAGCLVCEGEGIECHCVSRSQSGNDLVCEKIWVFGHGVSSLRWKGADSIYIYIYISLLSNVSYKEKTQAITIRFICLHSSFCWKRPGSASSTATPGPSRKPGGSTWPARSMSRWGKRVSEATSVFICPSACRCLRLSRAVSGSMQLLTCCWTGRKGDDTASTGTLWATTWVWTTGPSSDSL